MPGQRQMRSRLLFMFILGLMSIAYGRAEVDEYQMKAVFVYNFVKFVEWPSEAFKTPGDPITICIAGQDPFNGSLEAAVRGKAVEGRPFLIKRFADVQSAASCQILFVASSERKRFRTILSDLKAAGVLTVGETQGFALEGGVINFKLEDGKVRLEVNLAAAQQERLHISSKLLSLADIVKK
jgi:hypothetical protein